MDIIDRQTMEIVLSPEPDQNTATTSTASDSSATTTNSQTEPATFGIPTSSTGSPNASDSDVSSHTLPLSTAAEATRSLPSSPTSSVGADTLHPSPHQVANHGDQPTTDSNVDRRMTEGGDGTSSLHLLAQLAEDALSSGTEDAFSDCPDDLAESLYANLVAHGEQPDDIEVGGNGCDPMNQQVSDPQDGGRSSTVCSSSFGLTTPSIQQSGSAGQCLTPQINFRPQLTRPQPYMSGTAATTTTCWSDRGPDIQQFWPELSQLQQQRIARDVVGSLEQVAEEPGVSMHWPMGEANRGRNGSADQSGGLDVGLSTDSSTDQQVKFLSHPGLYYDPVGLYSTNPIYAPPTAATPRFYQPQQQQQNLQYVQSQNLVSQHHHFSNSSPPLFPFYQQQPSGHPTYHQPTPTTLGQSVMPTSMPSAFPWSHLTMPDAMSNYPVRQQQQPPPSQSNFLQMAESFIESFANRGAYSQQNYVDSNSLYPPGGHLAASTTSSYGERAIQQPAYISNPLTGNPAWLSRSADYPSGGQIPYIPGEHHHQHPYASSQSRSSSASTGVTSNRSPSLDTPPPLEFHSPSPPRRYADHSTITSDAFSQHPGLHSLYRLPTPTAHHLHHPPQQQQSALLGWPDNLSATQSYFQQWFDDAESSGVLDMRTKSKPDETDALNPATDGLGQREVSAKFTEHGGDKQVDVEFVGKDLPESSEMQSSATATTTTTTIIPHASGHSDPAGLVTGLAVCRSPCAFCRKSVPRFQILSEPPASSTAAADSITVPPLPTFASQFAGMAKMPLSGQPVPTAAVQDAGERSGAVRKPKKAITVKQMLLSRGQFTPPPPFVGGVGNLRPYLPPFQPPQTPISNAPVLHQFQAERGVATAPVYRSARLPCCRPPNILSRYPPPSATVTTTATTIPTTSDMYLAQPPLQLSGDSSSTRSLLKNTMEQQLPQQQQRHLVPSSTSTNKQPYPLYIASTDPRPLPVISRLRVAENQTVGQGSEVAVSVANQPMFTATTTTASAMLKHTQVSAANASTQLRHLLSRDVVVRPGMLPMPPPPPPKRDDMRRTRSMFPDVVTTTTVALSTVTSITPEEASSSFVVMPSFSLEMPRLIPAVAGLIDKSEHAESKPPRHYDMEAIQIGTFKMGRSSDRKNRNKLKVFFSKRKLVYEFSVEHWRLPPLSNPPLVPYMAAVDIPFAIVTAIHCNEEQILVAVSEAPRQYVGARPVRAGAGVNFDRSRTYDVTGGQIAVCHIHKISLKRRQVDSLRFHLESIDERFKVLLTAPIFEAIADIGDSRFRTRGLGAGPVIELSRKPGQEISDANDGSPLKKHCIIEVITPQPVVEGSSGILCHCQVSCRSNRCSCMKSKSKCGMGSPGCLCKDCDNPLNLFESMGIRLEAVLLDTCLLQRIITFRGDVSDLLETVITYPCCMYEAPMKVCIPGLTRCPNEDCSAGTGYKFSWCNMQLCDEDSNPRNHCMACRACKDPTELHCDVCRRCLPLEGKDTRCPNCHTAREFDYTEQCDMTNLMYRCSQAQNLLMPLLLPITTAPTTTTTTNTATSTTTATTTTTVTTTATAATIKATATIAVGTVPNVASKATVERGADDAPQLTEQPSDAGGSAVAAVNGKEPPAARAPVCRKGVVRSSRNRRTTAAAAAALEAEKLEAEEERRVVPAKKRRTSCGRPRNRSR